MRILHVINCFQPVLGYQETFLARAQRENGHEVLLITSDRYAPHLFKGGASNAVLGDRIRCPGRFTEEGIEVLRLPVLFEILGNQWLLGLEREIDDFSPDAIHVHSTVSFTSLRVALMGDRLERTRIVFDDHMTYNAVRGRYIVPLYYAFRLLFRNRLLKVVDEFVAVTSETKRFMNEVYGLPLDRIRTIPLGCDPTRLKRDELARVRLRREHGIRDEIVFCYAGKITPDKGVHLLIEAALELIKSKKNIMIMCVGGRDEVYFRNLMKVIESEGLEKRFIFLPAVPNRELTNVYSMADVGVWPKQCSVTMIEAMACNIPVIMSDNSGATERVLQMTCGLTYKEGDVADLKAKMEKLLDRETRNSMGANARRYAESCDWKEISKEFETLYEHSLIIRSESIRST